MRKVMVDFEFYEKNKDVLFKDIIWNMSSYFLNNYPHDKFNDYMQKLNLISNKITKNKIKVYSLINKFKYFEIGDNLDDCCGLFNEEIFVEIEKL